MVAKRESFPWHWLHITFPLKLPSSHSLCQFNTIDIWSSPRNKHCNVCRSLNLHFKGGFKLILGSNVAIVDMKSSIAKMPRCPDLIMMLQKKDTETFSKIGSFTCYWDIDLYPLYITLYSGLQVQSTTSMRSELTTFALYSDRNQPFKIQIETKWKNAHPDQTKARLCASEKNKWQIPIMHNWTNSPG